MASFERRLRGAAQTPLALPYPFGTSTHTRIYTERDTREPIEKMYFERYSPVILSILMHIEYEEVDNIKLGNTLFPNEHQILSSNKSYLL